MRVAAEKKAPTRAVKKATSGSGSAAPRKRSAAKETSDRPSSDKSTSTSRRASAAQPKRASAADIAQRAAAQLAGLTGKQVEGVTSFEKTENGWTVEIDVLELSRVPNTTDVLATYEVEVDRDGELEGYRRAHRYVRGVAGEQ